ncbi:MAG TPA: pantoate--beta-alanine ligase [Fibrobacteraceae bacterium]|nr:pantoate--beta-alanine ligase [Fibrobacteraceae bacterium]
MKIKIVHTLSDLRSELAKVRKAGKSIGCVPTMGALHAGHMSLVKKSASQCAYTVVSIFVNPIQFGKNEDLDKYPRRLEADAALCAQHGARLIFAPAAKDMYDPNHQTYIYNGALENLYCGKYRPGHFRGVLTVVAKLFLAVQPDKAYFGRKDYQQAFLIRKMVSDLNFPVEVCTVPISRDKTGLARSSRNDYMTAPQRASAAAIHRGLVDARKAFLQGKRDSIALCAKVSTSIEAAGGKVQYIELVSRKTLQPLHGKIQEKVVILVAAFFGETRLIDNQEL